MISSNAPPAWPMTALWRQALLSHRPAFQPRLAHNSPLTLGTCLRVSQPQCTTCETGMKVCISSAHGKEYRGNRGKDLAQCLAHSRRPTNVRCTQCACSGCFLFENPRRFAFLPLPHCPEPLSFPATRIRTNSHAATCQAPPAHRSVCRTTL